MQQLPARFGRADQSGSGHERGAATAASTAAAASALPLSVILAGLVALAGVLGVRAQGVPDPARNLPDDEMALVFSMGYAGDLLPQEPEAFDAVMKTVAEAGYNTVLASYEDWRLPILEKHGLKLMVDMLDERHHIYRNLEGAEGLARSLVGEDRIWGYHLFSDTASTIVPGRQRDIDMLRSWDPGHPTFVGTQQHVKGTLRQMTSPDVVGYYDYHWTRDRGTHFPNLEFFGDYADEKDAFLYRWIQVDPGLAGKGNPNRIRYTVFSSMARGLKGVMWFLGSRLIDTRSWQWNQFGLDVASVNHDVLPLAAVFAPLRHVATWSTRQTVNANNDPRGAEEPPIPPGLDAIPEDFWVQVESGEVILGQFRHPDETDETGARGEAGRYVFVANHNAYVAQALTMTLAVDVARVEWFDRAVGAWVDLDPSEGRVGLEILPGNGELLRFGWDEGLPTAEPTTEPTAVLFGMRLFLPAAWKP
jgi:hypothetical protein